MKNSQLSRLLHCAKEMPPLKHSTGWCDGKFDIEKSEVVKWLMSRPEIMQYIFNRVGNAANLITYDNKKGTWQGADYHA